MDKKLINGNVLVYRKDNYRFQGEVIDIDDDFITLNDIKVGLMLLALSEIKSIRKLKDEN